MWGVGIISKPQWKKEQLERSRKTTSEILWGRTTHMVRGIMMTRLLKLKQETGCTSGMGSLLNFTEKGVEQALFFREQFSTSFTREASF